MEAQRRSSTTAALDRLFLEFQSAVAGRYSIERELGRGGMGVVYLAREVRLDRLIALKLLPPRLAVQPGPRERFLREARTAAKLSHPNIIPIYAVDEVQDYVFFAMAYVEGETLTARVRRRGPLPPSEAARVLREVAWALSHAHTLGVIHRDVKPDNIMLEEATGRALVTDFGIAAQVTGAAGLDGGEVIGTPEFMSPEQALGESVDAKSDLYALGIVAYFTLSGRLPFEGVKPSEVLGKQVTQPPPPLGDVAGAPRRLIQAVERCLAKERDDRLESAAALADQLGLALEQRREVPVALRVFVKRNAQVGGAVVLLYTYFLTSASLLVGALTPAGLGLISGVGTFLGGMSLGPLGLLFYQARRVLKAGFAREDLSAAFGSYLEQGREERLFEFGHSPSLYERVIRLIYGVGFGLSFLGLVLPGSVALTGWGLTLGIGAGTLCMMRLQRRKDVAGGFWNWLWKTRLGKWVFREAGRFLPARAALPASTHRATELALGMAAERLFDELPKETREELRELPDVLRRLEHDAGRMRARLEELNDALQSAGERGRLSGQIAGDIKARRDRTILLVEHKMDMVTALSDSIAVLQDGRLIADDTPENIRRNAEVQAAYFGGGAESRAT